MSGMRRYPFHTRFAAVGEREFRAIASNSSLGRDSLRVLTTGLDTTEYQKNPVLLFSHDPAKIIGRCLDLTVSGDSLVGYFTFAPAGVSQTADEVCGLLKADCLNALSIGFDIVEQSSPDRQGVRNVTRSTLMEISLVAVPALPAAAVTDRARSHDFASRQAAKAVLARNQPVPSCSFADRQAHKAALRAARPVSPSDMPVFAGDIAGHARAMSDHLQRRVLAYAAAVSVPIGNSGALDFASRQAAKAVLARRETR